MVYLLTGFIIIFLAIIFVLYVHKQVQYEVQLLICNSEKEVLLVFDKKTGCFILPSHKVLFDQIPTEVVCELINKLFGEANWDFDWKYHSQNHKYDRVRDDVGPIYSYDSNQYLRKTCCLCYAIILRDFVLVDYLKKQAPYPEFYTLESIYTMSDDIKPPKIMIDLIERALSM